MKKLVILCFVWAFALAQNPSQTVTINKSDQNTKPQQRIIDANQAEQNTPQSVSLTPENVHIAIAQLAMATNSTLPQRLDPVTVFDRANSKDNVLKYYYILNDDEEFVLSKFKKERKDKFLNDIKANARNAICTSEMSQNLLNAGAIFSYNFELRNGTKYFNFNMDKSACE